MSDQDPPGQRTALMPADVNALTTAGPLPLSEMSYQEARFMPRIVSLTAMPLFDGFNETTAFVVFTMTAMLTALEVLVAKVVDPP